MQFDRLDDGEDVGDALAALVWPDGTKGLTENGIDDLQSLLADIRTWDGGIRQFLVDEQCDP
ncbi:transposase, partial [Pseudomonas sp. BGM005]|nr:transposase [Pseudomonas sp. BG5]